MADLSRRIILKASVAGAALLALPLRAAAAGGPGMVSFDEDWRFHLGDAPAAQQPVFVDAGWRIVHLPHDWSIEDRFGAPKAATNWVPPVALANPNERPKDAPTLSPRIPIVSPVVPAATPDGPPLQVGPFDPHASGGGWKTGWVVGGTGWYRKHFTVTDLAPGEQVEVIFDGAYMITEAWLNGTPLGRNISGYLPFAFDLTPHLDHAGPNILAVRVANEGSTARWYSGSGLYRHVWLRRTGSVRIPDHGIVVRTDDAGPQRATIEIGVEVENRGRQTSPVECRIAIVDAGGHTVASASKTLSLAPDKPDRIAISVEVDRPALWCPETPNLYHADVSLRIGGRITDRQSLRFGIRSLRVSPEAGLEINGKSYKLRGACVHHDNGLLGAVAIDRAERRKVELLKASGFNAIRCSHNPHSRAFLDACDELGMLVMDELFDVWEQDKFSAQGYQVYFKDHWREDVNTWVRRDRNHPSIVMWSLGNEIPEVSTPRGIEIGTQMRALILDLDPTRLITNALTPAGFGKGGQAARKLLDVSGYNYAFDKAEQDHAASPAELFVITESFAKDACDIWRLAEKSPWFLGEFLWTGIDYLGETGLGSSRLVREGSKPDPTKSFMGVDLANLFVWDYPAFQAGCGDIDILGLKKPAGYYRDVVWGRSPIELFVQRPLPAGMNEALTGWAWNDELASWSWPHRLGEPVTVRVYTRADAVALQLNGTEIARKKLATEDRFKAQFTIPYAPGVLTAIAYASGAEIARKTLTTVGVAVGLRLRVERQHIESGPDDLAYVFAEVIDAQGRILPDAAVPVSFGVQGAARLLRAGSANPYGIESFEDARTRTFHGVAQVIVAPVGRRGNAIVTVDSEGLAGGRLTIRVG